MTDEQLKQFRELRETIDRLVEAFPKLSEALNKHSAIIKAQQESLDLLGAGMRQHQTGLEDLARLPNQVTACLELVARHDSVLLKLTGTTDPAVN